MPKASNNKIFLYSTTFSIGFAAFALIWGFITASQVVLFDGMFYLIGLALTYLSMLSMKFIDKEDFRSYPFGKDTFEPFIVIVQYIIILILGSSNIVNAIQVILAGGRDMNIESGILYGILSSLFGFCAFKYLKHLKISSPIEEVEVEQWKFSFLFSLAIFIGFSLGWILIRVPLLSPYIGFLDPALAILITLIFIKTAISAIRKSVKELLMATPSEDLTSLITEKIDGVNKKYDLSRMILRIGKVGGQIIIEIDYVIEENSVFDSIRVQERLRTEIAQSLADIPYEKWMNVNFIGDIKWAL